LREIRRGDINLNRLCEGIVGNRGIFPVIFNRRKIKIAIIGYFNTLPEGIVMPEMIENTDQFAYRNFHKDTSIYTLMSEIMKKKKHNVVNRRKGGRIYYR
jgi:hypothetical protein